MPSFPSDAPLSQPHLTAQVFSLAFGAIRWQQSQKEMSKILGVWAVPGHAREAHKQDFSFCPNFGVRDSASAVAREKLLVMFEPGRKVSF